MEGLLLSSESVLVILQRHQEAAVLNLYPIFTPEPGYIWTSVWITGPCAHQFQDNRPDHLHLLSVDVTCLLKRVGHIQSCEQT